MAYNRRFEDPRDQRNYQDTNFSEDRGRHQHDNRPRWETRESYNRQHDGRHDHNYTDRDFYEGRSPDWDNHNYPRAFRNNRGNDPAFEPDVEREYDRNYNTEHSRNFNYNFEDSERFARNHYGRQPNRNTQSHRNEGHEQQDRWFEQPGEYDEHDHWTGSPTWNNKANMQRMRDETEQYYRRDNHRSGY